MALLFHHRTTTKSKNFTFPITNPSLLRRLFSGDGGGGDKPPANSNSPFSSYFSDVKESLKQQKPSYPPPPINPPTFTDSSKQTSIGEIQRNLSEFRRRTSAPPPGDPSSLQQISFQDIYKRNVFQKPDESKGDSDLRTVKPGGKLNLDAIRESLQKMRAEPGGGDGGRMSLPEFKDVLKSTPSDSASSKVIGGTSPLPESVFGRELRRDGSSAAAMAGMKTEFLKMYKHKELGEKLKKLRPEGKEFSIRELSERLIRLREMEEKESQSAIKGLSFTDLRATLVHLNNTEVDKAKKNSLQRIEILGQLGGTPNYLLGPPKEHLVEKYFHPDNMSSAEKLKIELAKVRDEFKMSESDCGSARVQVAQLTTKIKHLSYVLHKKDVHSRKGLIAMVQRRKRLLKYLRRTDWDSYCFVISKLGLRDNPEHSYKTRTRGQSRQAVSA